jgi:hypothetical protein
MKLILRGIHWRLNQERGTPELFVHGEFRRIYILVIED